MSTVCYLRMNNDALADAEHSNSIATARAKFKEAAKQLDGYGQKITATLHVASSMAAAVEYPDYLLELGSRGGLKSTRL